MPSVVLAELSARGAPSPVPDGIAAPPRWVEVREARAGRRKGLRATGRLGILELATRGGLVDFEQAVDLLQQINVRSPEDVLAVLLEKHRKDKTIKR